MTEKVAVKSTEGGIVTFADDLIEHFSLKHGYERSVNRIIIERVEVVAGDERTFFTYCFHVFCAANLAENDVSALYHLFKMISAEAVSDKRAYAR